jgi:hypothetical protein
MSTAVKDRLIVATIVMLVTESRSRWSDLTFFFSGHPLAVKILLMIKEGEKGKSSV